MSSAAANLGSVSAASANDTTSASGVRPETSAREMINAALARCCSSAFASWNSCSLGTPRCPCRRSSFTTLHEGDERGVELVLVAGVQDLKLHPLRKRRFLQVSDDALEVRIVRVH